MKRSRQHACVDRGVVAFIIVASVVFGTLGPVFGQSGDAAGNGLAAPDQTGGGVRPSVPELRPFGTTTFAPFRQPVGTDGRDLIKPQSRRFPAEPDSTATQTPAPVVSKFQAALNRAAKLQMAESWDDAVEAYDRAIALAPNTGRAYRDRGLVQRKRGKFDRAWRDLDRAVALDPKDWCAFVYRAFLAHESGQGDDRVISELSAAVELQPRMACLLRERADAYAHKNADELALADYQEAVRLAPRDAYCRKAIATIDLKHGRLREAIARFDRAIALAPNDANAYAWRGWSRVLCGEFDAALADWAEAVRIDPWNPWVHKCRGAVYSGRGAYRRAIAEFTVALGTSPEERVLLLARANARLETGAAALALVDLLRVQELKPDLPCLPFLLARAYEGIGQHDRAQAERKRAAQASPESALLSVGVDIVDAIGRADFDAALAACTRYEALDPRNASADLLRGCIFYVMGDDSGAIRTLDRVLAHDRRCMAAYLMRARAYARAGKAEPALADLEAAFRLAPDNPIAHYGRGRVCADQGRLRDAVNEFSLALQAIASARQVFGVFISVTAEPSGPGCARMFLVVFDDESAGTLGSVPWSVNHILVGCSPSQIYRDRGMVYLRLGRLDQALADYHQVAVHLSPWARTAAIHACAQAIRGQWVVSIVQLARALE